MKKSTKIFSIIAAAAFSLVSCNKFLDYTPTGVIDEDKAMSDPEGMVTSAYAMLGDCWYTCPFNLWPYGDVASDDALKGGGGTTDTEYHPFEIWSTLTDTHGPLDELWFRLYVGISRCNRAIISIDRHGKEVFGDEVAAIRRAEVRFIRAHFYYKLVTVFNRVPWIDEVVYANQSQEKTGNTEFSHNELLFKLIDEFKVAYDTLPEKMEDGGRANRIAAASYIAKCYLDLAWGDGYEATTGKNINKDYMQQVVNYTNDVVGSSYGYLEDYGDIFLPEHDNSKESIFAVQASDYSEDNTRFGRGNWSNVLNGTFHIWKCGHDFLKPSQNFVDAFKTVSGLPDFDGYTKTHEHPVNGVVTSTKWDPRLFHTVGMPTFPYKYEAEYTLTTDNTRTPDTYGFYTSMKGVPQRSKGETYNDVWQAFAMNEYVFRYTDVMLMRAEALIELGELGQARTIINDIRDRAANSISKHIGYAAEQCEIKTYPASYFATIESARQCLRWERRLEMGMEHSRFFDLRRWGIASETLNNYFAIEQNDSFGDTKYAGYLKDAHFTAGKNEFWPIPYNQLYYIPNLYEQNTGY